MRRALVASLVVTIPLTAIATTVVGGDGDLPELFAHSGFWVFIGKSVVWTFVVGFAASALTVFLISRKEQ
jgi:hypothetical protein